MPARCRFYVSMQKLYYHIRQEFSGARKKDTSDVGYILLSMISYLRYCVCISNLIHVLRHNTHHSTIASVQKQDDARRESQQTHDASTIVRSSFDATPLSASQFVGSSTNQRLMPQPGLEQRDTGRLAKRLTTVPQAVHVEQALYLCLFVKCFAFRAAYGLLN